MMVAKTPDTGFEIYKIDVNDRIIIKKIDYDAFGVMVITIKSLEKEDPPFPLHSSMFLSFFYKDYDASW